MKQTEQQTRGKSAPPPTPVKAAAVEVMPDKDKGVLATVAPMGLTLPDDAPTGFEFGQPEDQLLPRIGLCQSMTPQRKKGNDLYIAGLNEGDFFNNVTQENYGPAIDVIPLLKYSSRIYFAPMEKGGGILCRSFNAINGGELSALCKDCKHSDWTVNEHNERAKPECTLFINYPVYVVKKGGDVDLAVMSFKSTSLGIGRQWYTRMSMITMPKGGPAPMYLRGWRIKSAPKKKDAYEWYSCAVEALGFAPARLVQRAVFDARGLLLVIGKTMVFDQRGMEDEIAAEVREENPLAKEM